MFYNTRTSRIECLSMIYKDCFKKNIFQVIQNQLRKILTKDIIPTLRYSAVAWFVCVFLFVVDVSFHNHG